MTANAITSEKKISPLLSKNLENWCFMVTIFDEKRTQVVSSIKYAVKPIAHKTRIDTPGAAIVIKPYDMQAIVTYAMDTKYSLFILDCLLVTMVIAKT